MTRRTLERPNTQADILLFNKPFQVLSQFCSDSGKSTLSEWIPFKNIYAAGRLDYDSEGLLLLTDNGLLQAQIAHPQYKMQKTYWAQVEGTPAEDALLKLRGGVDIGDCVTQPCHVQIIPEPSILWPRTPPIRYRASIPTTWLEISISEGKNRQVRRMTAKIGHPTLRLIRYRVGPWTLDGLSSGQYRWVSWEGELPKTSSTPHHRRKKTTAHQNRRINRRRPHRSPSE